MTTDINKVISSVKGNSRKYGFSLTEFLGFSGGAVVNQPRDIERKVLKEFNRSMKHFANGAYYVPNIIKLRLSSAVMRDVEKYMNIFKAQLEDTIRSHIADCHKGAKNASTALEIKIIEDSTIPAGGVIVDADVIDPVKR